MNKKERIVLKKAVDSHEGQISPANIINGYAEGDQGLVERLVGRGYLERIYQFREGLHQSTYSIIFYAVTEKGLMEFAQPVQRCIFWAKNNVALWVGVFSVMVGALSIIFAGLGYSNSVQVLNRPYIAVNPTGLDELRTGKIKSDLDNLPEQLIEKNINFILQNTGQSPAAFRIDLSEFEEVGITKVIPQQNTEGVIFPGESKEVLYLLEIHSSFPSSESEKKEQEAYLKKSREVIDGSRKYFSRIAIIYDYLDKKGKGEYKTFIDQTFPKTGFSENKIGRVDGYSHVWVVSFDSK